MVRSLVITFLLFCCVFPYQGRSAIPADISFIVIDLKFNEQDGVKICEAQEGVASAFNGIDFLEKRPKVISERLCGILERYTHRFWFFTFRISGEFWPTFKKRAQWKELFYPKDLVKDKSFTKWSRKKVKSPGSLSSYHGILVSHFEYLTPSFLNKNRGILTLNAAFLPHFGDSFSTDKLSMSRLFDGDEEVKALKPKWIIYDKQYSKELVNEILDDFSTELLVIKPRVGLQGKGVLIIHRNQLDETLQYIFGNNPELINDPDDSYHYWAIDKDSDFFVEEFYPSTPITVPHAGEGQYDATARTAVVLTYDKGVADCEFLCFFWKLPAKSLDDEGTLTEKHKSFSESLDLFDYVESETRAKMEQQLKQPLLRLYKKLLQ